uniref:hypothetical protein n=1 Tax=Algoriphagus sp. TaxID=1872435 RepID=UPI00404729BA
MRKFHTLTFNETTYTIKLGNRINDIFINGQETDWFTDYDTVNFGDEEIPKGIRLKNHTDDKYSGTYYLYLNTIELTFTDVVYIIKTIEEESFR